jgi:hypothetical protein
MLKTVHLHEVIAMSEKANRADSPPSEQPTSEELDKVACDVCLTEIPKSVAVSSEADEYTQYFCGTECYVKWCGEKNEDDTADPQ